ncbi:MAG: hypothetical protein JWM21_4737 [Acidobacteria bacterium]|nr:hypothetical protein [Acidobacteriota bacterium]
MESNQLHETARPARDEKIQARPSWPVFFSRNHHNTLHFPSMAVGEFADQGEQRQVHRDDDRTDGDTEEANQYGLD